MTFAQRLNTVTSLREAISLDYDMSHQSDIPEIRSLRYLLAGRMAIYLFLATEAHQRSHGEKALAVQLAGTDLDLADLAQEQWSELVDKLSLPIPPFPSTLQGRLEHFASHATSMDDLARYQEELMVNSPPLPPQFGDLNAALAHRLALLALARLYRDRCENLASLTLLNADTPQAVAEVEEQYLAKAEVVTHYTAEILIARSGQPDINQVRDRYEDTLTLNEFVRESLKPPRL